MLNKKEAEKPLICCGDFGMIKAQMIGNQNSSWVYFKMQKSCFAKIAVKRPFKSTIAIQKGMLLARQEI